MLRKWLLENANSHIKGSFAYRLRKARMKTFEDFYQKQILFDQTNLPKRILDLGGELSFWRSMEFKYEDTAAITLLNLKEEEIPKSCSNFMSIAGDATNLSQYKDKSFDLVFSNSVIEHVGDFAMQRKMAQEMMRVGKHCYLQTPNKYFFLEPHFFFPFFQFLPLRIRAFLLKNFRLCFGYRAKEKTYKDALACARSIQLLTSKELKQLFPNVPLHKEKWAFMVKSFYLYF